MAFVLAGLFVFAMRVIDMSLDTLRLLFVMRGRKVLAGVIGACQAAVFILAVSAVLKGPLNVWTVSGYALGFGTGIIVGMFFEEKLALGYTTVQIYSVSKGREITSALREAQHAVTEFRGHGRDGTVRVIQCIIARKNVNSASKLIESIDPDSFITVDDIKPLRHGYFRR